MVLSQHQRASNSNLLFGAIRSRPSKNATVIVTVIPDGSPTTCGQHSLLSYPEAR